MRRRQHAEGFGAAPCGNNCGLPPLEECGQREYVARIIIYYENLHSRERMVIQSAVDLKLGARSRTLRLGPGNRRRQCQGKVYRERASAAWSARYGELAAEELDQRPAYRYPQAGSAIEPRIRTVNL